MKPTLLRARVACDLNKNYLGEYLCKCGKTYLTRQYEVNSGASKTCGCSRGEQHGKSNSPEYRIWNNMKRRCFDPKNNQFHNYGGRGIKVCERWLSFFKFLRRYGTEAF